MKKSEIINKIHLGFITYFLFGFMIESQRKYLILYLPSLQYQFLVNNNQCLLTQLENKLIKNENDKKNEDDKEFDSFIGSKLKEYNIDISQETRERAIHTFVYGCFLMNYFLFI